MKGIVNRRIGEGLGVADDRTVFARRLCGWKGRHDLTLYGRGAVFEPLIARGKCVDVEPRVRVHSIKHRLRVALNCCCGCRLACSLMQNRDRLYEVDGRVCEGDGRHVRV